MENLKKSDLTEGVIWKHIVRIAVPAMFGYLFNSLYNWIDTFWAGKISTEALAALSITFPLILLSFAVSQGVFGGAMVLVSNSLGEKNIKNARCWLEKSLGLSLLVGILAAVFIRVAGRPILFALGAREQVLEYGLQYVNVLSIGIPFMVIGLVLNAGLLARGNTKYQRNVYIMNAVINIGLDPLFMYGFSVGGRVLIPAMGIRGIAFATVLVQALGAVLFYRKCVKENYLRGDKISRFFFKAPEGLKIAYYGLPPALNLGLISFGLALVNFFLAKLGGSTATAAYGVGLRIEQMALIPSFGIGSALSAIVGQNNGAKQYDRISTAYKTSVLMVIVLLVGLMLPIAITSPWIIRIFSTEAEVIKIASRYLWFSLAIFMAYQIIGQSSSTMQGMKYPIIPMILMATRQLILPLIFIPLFAYMLGWGVYGVFCSVFVCAWITALAMNFSMFHIIRRTIKNQKKEEKVMNSEQNS